ncbi:hypothetical protein [Streptomyces sp. SID12488]|uniref:hypothetical protein n=1 Tax=Streptomyces sp. SID12488 TaxID=2706040 RepID=UPI0031BB52A9
MTVCGEIDHHVKDILSDALLSEDGTARPQRIVVDLSGVTFSESKPESCRGPSTLRRVLRVFPSKEAASLSRRDCVGVRPGGQGSGPVDHLDETGRDQSPGGEPQ